jgi:hypothetical protein
MIKKFLMLLAPIFLILILASTGCKKVDQKVDQEAISFADRVTEECLIALNNQDYESYKKDLDNEMLDAVPEEEFMKFSSYLKDNVGQYVPGSKEYSSSSIQSGMILVIYETYYTIETGKVMVGMVISKSDEGISKISGSWFDSPKLRETEYE